MVVTLGSISSHLLARSGSPSKPAIAGTIIDASWQAIPQKEGASGVRNLTYIDQSYPVGGTLGDFHHLIPFRRLAIVLDRDLLQGIPQLKASATRMVRQSANAQAVIVAAGDRVDEILGAIPAGVDAVYLTPLPTMSEGEYARLIAGLNARRLPTLSYTADPTFVSAPWPHTSLRRTGSGGPGEWRWTCSGFLPATTPEPFQCGW